jgi:hypothetical protein
MYGCTLKEYGMECNLKLSCPGMAHVTLNMKMKLIILQEARNYFGGAE